MANTQSCTDSSLVIAVRCLCQMHTHVPTCIQVHAAWAEAGLAPKLIECQPLPGGSTMVVMQQLLMQDGWSMLCSVPQLEQQDALAAAQQAMSKAHDVIIPGTT